MTKHISKDFSPRGEAKFPVLKPGHRRCACQEEIPAEKWKEHVGGCVKRAKKQDAEKVRREEA